MGHRFEPCRGHLNQQEKALSSKAFLLVILFFIPNFVPKSLYSQNKRVSSKDSLFISHSFSSKKPPRRWFLSINRQTLRLWVGTWGKCVPRFLPYPYDPHLLRLPRLVKEQNRNIGYKTRDHVLTQPVYINPIQSYQSHMSYLNTEENISGSW